MSFPTIIFAAVSALFLWTTFAALSLTIIGLYSLLNLNIVMLVTAAFLSILALTFPKNKNIAVNLKVSINAKQEQIKLKRHHLWILVLCLLALFFYASYTTEYIIGGRDPGVYAIQGSYINKTGGLYIHDEYITQNYEKLQNIIQVGYPGFYSAYERGISNLPGQLVPQFLPMFPSILAVGYSLAGVAGALRINAFIGVFALLAFYAFGKQLIGRKGALLATVFLALNPSQIWNARITQTELLSQFLFFSAMAVFVVSYKRNNWKLATVSGVLLGLGCFTRIDSYIFGLGIYLCTACILLVHKKKTCLFLGVTIPYTLLMGLSMAYGYLYSYPYYSDLWKDGSLKILALMNVFFAMLVPLGYCIRRWIIDRRPGYFKHLFIGFTMKKRSHLPQWSALILFALFLFAYFIRPIYFTGGAPIGTEQYFKANSLVEFGFYVPEIAMLFSILGIFYLVKDKGIYPHLIFLSISIASIIGYTYRPSITPDHIWASRRWITVNIPAVLLFSVYGLNRFRIKDKRVSQWAKMAVVCIIIVFMLAKSGLFMFQGMMNGYSQQLEQIGQALPDEGLKFTDDVQLASPLTYIYGEKVYIIKEEGLSQSMAEYIRDEGPIYGVGWPNYSLVGVIFDKGISVDNISSHQLTGLYPEEVRGSFPRKLIQRDYDASIKQLNYSPENLYYTYSLATDFLTQNGIYKEDVLAAGGQAGFLLFGNYTVLPPGNYEFSFSGALPINTDGELGYIDITYNKGEQILAKQSLKEYLIDGQLNGSVAFTIDKEVSDVEFRIYTEEDVHLTVERVTLNQDK